MAINFPTSLDNFTNPVSGNTLDSPSHSLQHSDINDAVEAMQRKVGVGTAVAGSASAGQVLTISAAGTSTWSTLTSPGFVQIVPSSVAVGSGSGSVDANGKVTFSGASSVSLNDVFSSSYDNYKIVYTCTTSTENTVNLRMRVSGSDNTTSNYYFQRTLSKDGTTVQGGENLANSSWPGWNTNTTITPIEVELYSPFLSTATAFLGRYHKVETLATVHETATLSGIHNVASSFTGCTWTVGGGTQSGTLSVYGYR